MTDADLGQLESTQQWLARSTPVAYITSWDDEAADIRREQERDARDDERSLPRDDDFPHDASAIEQVAWLQHYADRHGLDYSDVERYFNG